MKYIYTGIVIVLLSITAFSQNDIEQTLNSRGEIFFKFKLTEQHSLTEISNVISIDAIKDGFVYAYANRTQFDVFKAYNVHSELVSEYYDGTKSITMAGEISEMENWDKYPTWDVYVEMMTTYAQDYPDICILDTIGFSENNKPLFCLVISDNVNTVEKEPRFLWTNTMHGDEIVCYVLSIRFADYLLSNYGSNDYVDSIVNNIRIYINPLANPDGTFSGSSDGSTIENATRTNANGIDLNRNFPRIDNISTSIESEIQAMIDYSDEHKFNMSVNTHSGAEVFNYPWDFWTSDVNPHADDNWWQYIGNIYCSTAISSSPNGYFQGISDNGYIEGADWYATQGCRQDYMMYFQHCREITLEWSNAKLLDAEELPNHWNYNYQSMLDYTAQVLYGFNGIITDSITNEPLVGEVLISDHDIDESQVYSRLPLGDYFRPIEPGTWTVSFSSDGYKTKVLEIQTQNNIASILDVKLVPLSTMAPDVDFEASETEIICNPLVEFYNLSEASYDTQYTWDFGDGSSTSSDTNPTHTYIANGTYTITLYAENNIGEDELIKTSYINVDLPDFASTINGSFCSGTGDASFYSDNNQEYNFYISIDDVSPYYTGTVCNISSWDESSTCFAQEVIEGEIFSIGLPDNSDGGNYNNDDSNHYLIFNCDIPLFLKTVKVYANENGERTINLIDNEGNILDSQTLNIDQGEQVLELNFELPIQDGLRLECEGPSGLWVSQAPWSNSFDYPFEISDVISINSNDFGFISDFRYPYFFDWQISATSCVSNRAEVFILDTLENVTANYTFDNNGLEYQFTNTSSNANSWQWNFGDDTESNEENPDHTYLTPGNYTVSLTSNNQCGTDNYSDIINVQNNITTIAGEQFKIFPNPSTNLIFIETSSNKYQIQLINNLGITVYSSNNCFQNSQIDISNLAKGFYFLRITNDDIYNIITIVKI